MNVSIDISMYPLREGFEEPIIDFIKKLRLSSFHTEENGLSTQIFGDFKEVTDFVNDNMHQALLDEENCVFTLKIVSSDRSQHEPTY